MYWKAKVTAWAAAVTGLVMALTSIPTQAYQGMPVPPLHVNGRYIQDPYGKTVLLHGWHEPSWSGFNGGYYVNYPEPSDYTDPSSVAGELNFFNNVADILSDPSPRYGYTHGWYTSFVRLVADNGPGSGLTPGWGPNGGGLVDQNQFNGWMNNLVVPYAQHCAADGLYVVLLGTPSTAYGSDGGHNMTQQYQQNLITYWSAVASNPRIKNAGNIIFEICNEPVNIETSFGANDWGAFDSAHWQAIRNFMQPIVNAIRNTGANNIILVPSLGYQSDNAAWASFPVSGTNIAYAAHMYPGWGNTDSNNPTSFLNSSYKPCADKYPLVITEMNWGWDGSGVTTEGFGNAVKSFIDSEGNMSYVVGMLGDNLGNLSAGLVNSTLGGVSGQAAFSWWPTYTGGAPSGVTFYQDYNYGGSAGAILGPGRYTTAKLAALGIQNDWVSSVKLPNGWTVTMYSGDNFSGTSWILTSDTPVFGSLSPSANDQMSSCIIAAEVPSITSLSPSSISGAKSITLTVNGSNFVNGSVVKWNGTNMPTTYVSPTQLTASINKYYTTLTSYPGTISVSVLNPYGNRSAGAAFTITTPISVPTISSLSPSSITSAKTFTLTVNGSNFVNGSVIKWNGTNMPTTYVSATLLTASINKYYTTLTSYPGTATVSVLNPDGGRSAGTAFTITAPVAVPAITSLSPSSVKGATSFTLTVNGTNFVSGSIIKWNGTNLATTFVSSTQLTAVINKYYSTLTSYPGSATVSILNPDGSRSSGTVFTITSP